MSDIISPHLAQVSFGDGRIYTVSTSDLLRRLPNFDNEITISQPGGQCREKETNVDRDIGTQCKPPECVEPVLETQVCPDSPASTVRRSTTGNHLHTWATLCWRRTRDMRNEKGCYDCFICVVMLLLLLYYVVSLFILA